MSSYRPRWDALALPDAIRKGRTDRARMSSTAVLTFPVVDLAGDYVCPDGLNFDQHAVDPFIDLEHARTPDVGGMPVAWARESLSEPGAPYAVEFKSLNCAPDGQPPEYHSLPVGTSYFDPGCRVSTQVFALVEQDALPAVSIEFRPVKGYMKALGPSPLEPRQAYRFEKADVIRWTLCARGVNPGALSLTKSLPQVPPPLAKILTDRRVNVGGHFEPLHPLILKALAPPDTPRRTAARVEKAMDEYDDQDDAVATAPGADMETENEQAVAPEAPALGGVSAKYKFAQTIEDACDEYLADMRSSDSPELRKLAEKFEALARDLAEKVKAAADKHDAKLNGGAAPEAAEGEEDSESADMEKDEEDGTYKAVRGVYKPVLKAVRAANVKRFRLADLQAAAPTEQKAQAEQEDPELKKLAAEFRKWQRLAS